MALSGPDTGGSQFFLTLAPQPHLDGHYTVFGRVVGGTAAMDALVQGDVMRDVTPLSRR
jgi:cyclophilin family peptidyl-prolyl cis-trans isomerase